MKKLIDRTLFLIGVIPVFLISIVLWVLTGSHPIKNVIEFGRFFNIDIEID